jgi:hypothetical protein
MYGATRGVAYMPLPGNFMYGATRGVAYMPLLGTFMYAARKDLTHYKNNYSSFYFSVTKMFLSS